MNVSQTRHGAVTVLKPEGPLIGAGAGEFASHAQEVLRESLGRFVVDASAISHVDSAGLEALVDTTRTLSDSGQSLRLCGANETLREVLDLTDLSGLFEHYEDVGTAVRSFL
ncbi:MAG: STAS domain-containing protein [Phycisphaerales bacterium]|jgi:anti-anti-sigma factor|nr:STAS domain-containing protein [Phycisphaeraceae bacterium]